MPLLLYIQVKPPELIRFGNPFSALDQINPDLLLLDADNQSEDLVINHQLQLINKANEVILILDVNPDSSPGKTTKLLEKILRQKGKGLSVFINGENKVIERMLKLTKANVQSQLNEQALYAALSDLVSSL